MEHKNTHCDFCGKLLTAEDPGVKMHHEYGYQKPMNFVHCIVCEKKYYPGPWHVYQYLGEKFWHILNTGTGKTKKIGPVQLKGVNYYERAREEAGRRNLSLAVHLAFAKKKRKEERGK